MKVPLPCQAGISPPGSPSSVQLLMQASAACRTSLAGDGRASVSHWDTVLAFHLCRARYKLRLNSQVKIGFGNFILVLSRKTATQVGMTANSAQKCSRVGVLDIANSDEDVLAKARVEVRSPTAYMVLALLLPCYPSPHFQWLNKLEWKKSWLFCTVCYFTQKLQSGSGLKNKRCIIFKQR